MTAPKKRLIKSLETLPDNLLSLIEEQYPHGYKASITRIQNARNEPSFVFPLETEDAVYLVKVPAARNSEGEYKVGAREKEFEEPEEENEPDDDFANRDDDEGDFNDEDSSRKEASYDPDFDG